MSLSDGNLVTFSYDDAYSLTREQRSGAAAYDITYTYDATGNRTGKLAGGTTTTYTVDAADRLTVENAAGTLTTYSFDAAGNNTAVNAAGALTTYTWDLTNRMTGLADAGGVTTLVSDATGLRRAKQDASGTTQFLWDGQTLLLEADGGGTTQAHYTAGPGGYGPLVAQRRGTTSSFYHPTDLGTIENLTDAAGNVTDTYASTAFGVPVATSGSTTNPFRYIGALGYYTDPTTGLSYVRARYLRPSTGSWLSVDPVASEPRYQYVGGTATAGVDPSGLDSPPGYTPGLSGPPLPAYDFPVGYPGAPYGPPPPAVAPSHTTSFVYGGDSWIEDKLARAAAAVYQLTHLRTVVDYYPGLPAAPRPETDILVLIGHGGGVAAVGPRHGSAGDIEPGPAATAFPSLKAAMIWACYQGEPDQRKEWCDRLRCAVVAPDGMCFGPAFFPTATNLRRVYGPGGPWYPYER